MSSRQLVSDRLIKGKNVNILGGDEDLNFPVSLFLSTKYVNKLK